MKNRITSLVATAGFAVFSTFALAQNHDTEGATPPKTNPDPAQHETDRMENKDTMAGNDQADRGSMKSDDFSKLDTEGTGRITAKQAKNDPWLKRHFKKCDKDSDGSVSQEEYSACRNMK